MSQYSHLTVIRPIEYQTFTSFSSWDSSFHCWFYLGLLSDCSWPFLEVLCVASSTGIACPNNKPTSWENLAYFCGFRMLFLMSLLVTSHLCVALWGLSLCSYLVAYTVSEITSFILIFLPDFPVSKSLENSELCQLGSCTAFTSILLTFSFVFCRLNCPRDLTEGYSVFLEACFPKILQELLCPWSLP